MYQKIALQSSIIKVIESTLKNNKKNIQGECINYLFIKDNTITVTDGKSIFKFQNALEGSPLSGAYKIISKNKIVSSMYELIIEEAPGVEAPPFDRILTEKYNKYEDGLSLTIEDHDLSISSAMIKLFKFTDRGYSYNLLSRVSVLECKWDVSKRQDQIKLYSKIGDMEVTAVLMMFKYE